MTRVHVLAVLGLAVLGGARCGGSTSSDGRPVVTAIVGQGGGQASSTGGTARLQVPAGAVTTDVPFTLQQVDAPGPGAVGPVFEIGPAGTIFRQPATLTFRYRQSDIGDADPFSLRVATYVRGAWQPMPSTVAPTGSTVSAEITHLSPWALVIVQETVVVTGGSGGNPGAGGGGGNPGAGGGGGAMGNSGSGGAGGDTGAGGSGGDPGADAGTDDAGADA